MSKNNRLGERVLLELRSPPPPPPPARIGLKDFISSVSKTLLLLFFYSLVHSHIFLGIFNFYRGIYQQFFNEEVGLFSKYKYVLTNRKLFIFLLFLFVYFDYAAFEKERKKERTRKTFAGK